MGHLFFWNCLKRYFAESHYVLRIVFYGVTLLNPEGFITYALGKSEAERALLDQADLPYTIVRPPSVAGPEDSTGRCQFYLQRLLDGGPLILTNGGVQIHQVIYRRDLAGGYLAAMISDKAVNPV